MIKKTLIYVLFLNIILVIWCGNIIPLSNQIQPDEKTYQDSIITIYNISKHYYDSLNMLSANISDIKKGNILKHGDTLIIKTDKGFVSFIDTLPNRENIESKIYDYYGYSNLLNSDFVDEICYESHNYYMIEKNSSRMIKIFYYPILNLSRKYFFCNFPSVDYSPQSNGIQIFERKSKDILLRYEMKFDRFELINPAWVGDSIIVTKIRDFAMDTTYCKIRIKF